MTDRSCSQLDRRQESDRVLLLWPAGLLAYCAVANASARTLTREEGSPPMIMPIVGTAGCLVLAFALPATSVLWSAVMIALGAAAYWFCKAVARA